MLEHGGTIMRFGRGFVMYRIAIDLNDHYDAIPQQHKIRFDPTVPVAAAHKNG